jgi:predicted dehydrogenase
LAGYDATLARLGVDDRQRESRRRRPISGDEATRVQEIIEAAYESSRTGKRQEVSG